MKESWRNPLKDSWMNLVFFFLRNTNICFLHPLEIIGWFYRRISGGILKKNLKEFLGKSLDKFVDDSRSYWS